MADESEVIAHLKRIERCLNVLAKCAIAEVLSRELADPRMKDLYEMTGKSRATEVAKKLRLSLTTVSETWQKWEQLGILVKDGNRYRKWFEE